MVNPQVKGNIISDKLLGSWIKCKRKAWLDLYENKNKKNWSPHRALQLQHQYKSLSSLNKKKPGKGVNACKKGNDFVVGLRLKGPKFGYKDLIGHPPLLQKIDGKSCFGNYSYRPVIVRQGRKITREHRLTLALWGILLEECHGSNIKEGLVISLREKGLESDHLRLNTKLKKEVLDSLTKLVKDLSSKKAPPLTTDRKKCSTCSWESLCKKEASQSGDLSEISGIGAKRKELLKVIGINNVKELARSKSNYLSNELERHGERDSQLAIKIIKQAKAITDNKEESICAKNTLPELKLAPGILIYDIESDPDIGHDFLHGFVAINRINNTRFDVDNAKYIPIIDLPGYDKKNTWKRINDNLEEYLNWPIIHYGETESINLYRLAEKEGASEEELKALKERFIDIHNKMRSNWILPINSYGLKAVAKWLGFKWHKRNVNGAKALLWWRQYIEEYKINRRPRESNKIKWILEYNYDDCIATWHITEWLLNKDKEITS